MIGRYLGRWATKWTAIEGMQRYLDKITEELVDVDKLAASGDPFLEKLGRAHRCVRGHARRGEPGRLRPHAEVASSSSSMILTSERRSGTRSAT